MKKRNSYHPHTAPKWVTLSKTTGLHWIWMFFIGPQSSSQGSSNTFTSFGDVISSRYMTK